MWQVTIHIYYYHVKDMNIYSWSFDNKEDAIKYVEEIKNSNLNCSIWLENISNSERITVQLQNAIS